MVNVALMNIFKNQEQSIFIVLYNIQNNSSSPFLSFEYVLCMLLNSRLFQPRVRLKKDSYLKKSVSGL